MRMRYPSDEELLARQRAARRARAIRQARNAYSEQLFWRLFIP